MDRIAANNHKNDVDLYASKSKAMAEKEIARPKNTTRNYKGKKALWEVYISN